MEIAKIKNLINDFKEKKPDIDSLRKKHLCLAEFLKGEFTEMNEYSCGVVSWKLSSGPTLGMFPEGHDFEFPTGENREKIIVIGGKFKTSNPVKIISGNYPMILAENLLHLDVYEPVLYLCIYEKKQQ